MIHNRNVSSSEFKIMRNYILAKPTELDKGEVKTETGLIMDLDQNQSIIDRPSTGVVITVGPDADEAIKVQAEVIWVEQEGLDLELSDGVFILMKDTSILGYKG